MPQYDGNGVRAKLPGKYTATTKDVTGQNVTFPVVIATGVNETTEKAYHDKNRLVVLGFAPSGVEYASPETLLANGWASSQDEADANYGPKWFIEFNKGNAISTSAPVMVNWIMLWQSSTGTKYIFMDLLNVLTVINSLI